MKYNHSSMRQRFIKEQKKLAKQYRAAGMSEEAIQEMYEFDLAVFRSNRNDLAHKAEIEEMTAFDRVTGESHYMDMDEFPADSIKAVYSSDDWINDIVNPQMHKALSQMSDDYLHIITLLMKGYQQNDIARIKGVGFRAINNKVARIKKIIKKII